MSLRLHKTVVQVVLAEFDDEGEVTGEQISQPHELFGINRLREFVDNLPGEIEKANASMNGAVSRDG